MKTNQSFPLSKDQEQQSSPQEYEQFKSYLPIRTSQLSKKNKPTKMLLFIIVLVFTIIAVLFFNIQWQIKASKILQNQNNKKASNPNSTLTNIQKGQQKNQDQIKALLKQIEQKDNRIKSIENKLKQQSEKINQLSQKIKTTKDVPKNPNIVKFDYTPNKQALPVNPSLKNSQGKLITDVLYKDEPIRKKRGEFVQQRIDVTNSRPNFQGLKLVKYNMVANEQMQTQAVKLNQQQWVRLQNKFKISSVKEELPMCVISAGYNNNANFRIQANLNSVFTQNYTNYKYVIINDASTDGSNEIFRNYFNYYKIDQSKYIYIENKKRVTALQNYYVAAINDCSKDSIVLILDGDDQYIGRNSFKLFNWGYQTKKVGVLYTNFYFYGQSVNDVTPGFTEEYSDNVKKNSLYRSTPLKISHPRTARAELFHQLSPQDIQQNGVFFKSSADIALFFPLMEIACGRVAKIEGQFNLAYIVNTGQNDYTLYANQQGRVFRIITSGKKKECYKQFDQKMSK